MTFEEVAQRPEARTYVDESTDEVKLELSTEEAGAKIYYTTDGRYRKLILLRNIKQRMRAIIRVA